MMPLEKTTRAENRRETGERGVYVLQKDDLSRWVSGREEERIGCLLQHGLE